MAEITEDQAAIYDRQLRVWGAEVQKRLNAARVLIAGFGALASEIAKNIVLAGVGSVSILDNTSCSTYGEPNFLIPADSPADQPVSAAAVKELQAMNPHVKVHAQPGSVNDLAQNTALIQQHDVVILLDQPLPRVHAADQACSKLGVKFFAATVRGPNSFVFANLRSHSYVPKKDASKPQSEVEVVHLQYVSLQQALSYPIDKFNRRSHPLLLVLRILGEFELSQGKVVHDIKRISSQYLPTPAACCKQPGKNIKYTFVYGLMDS